MIEYYFSPLFVHCIQISRKKEVKNLGCTTLTGWLECFFVVRSTIYGQQCTVHIFGQLWAMHVHNHDDKHIGFEHSITDFRAVGHVLFLIKYRTDEIKLLTRSTTSSEWRFTTSSDRKLFRFDKMEDNIYEILLIGVTFYLIKKEIIRI